MYPYLKHIIHLWSGDWVKQRGKRNEAIGEKNCLDKSGVNKRSVSPSRRQELCKCIGCILLEVTCVNKGHKFWGGSPIYFGKKEQNK